MGENSEKKFPKFDSTDSLTDFFDKTDLGDYIESMPEFEVELAHRRHFIAVDEDVAEKLSEISRNEHIPSGSIVNTWLREKLSNYSQKT